MATFGRVSVALIIGLLICVTMARVDPEIAREIRDNEEKPNMVGRDPDNKTGSDVTNGNTDDTNENYPRNESLDSDVIEREKWVLVTTKYTKKHRKTDFRNFTMSKMNVLGRFSLENRWKVKILEALEDGRTMLRPYRKPVLKSSDGNELTILSDDATMRASPVPPHRVNVTCTVVEEYSCSLTVTREVIRPCWFHPQHQCVEYRNEVVSANCRRRVQRCCSGYRLGASGYCERIQPVGPTCGGLLTSPQGVITSPNFPKFYPNDKTCVWEIKAPRGYKVVLKVIHLGIEDPVGACDLKKWECYELCEFDRIVIDDVTAQKRKTLCGYRAPTSEFVSTGNSVDVTFESDVSSGGTGFKMVYSFATEYELSSYHPQCPGGQTWQFCHLRCARTCQRHYNQTYMTCIDSRGRFSNIEVSRRDEITCRPGCACPPSAPIWHNGKCVKPESCPGDFFKCGKPAVSSKLKVVGGRTADKYAWPWMVQLESESIFHICGATLICSNWVLTAAHCFLNIDATALDLNPERYIVNVGKYWKNEQRDGRNVQTYEPERIIPHPGYRVDMETKVDKNDIALIKLTHCVDVTDYSRPACLPHPTIQGVTSETAKYAQYQQPITGTVCKVLGWGTTRGIGPRSDALKQASLKIQSGSACVYDSYVWKLMICAGGHENEDTCRGDSGGPLLCKRGNSEWFLDGVTSFGNACGKEGVAGGYTRVSSYIGWIRSYTGFKCES